MSIGGPADNHNEEEGGIFVDINITPLTDIFLVLLIIFMVTTTFADEVGQGSVKVALPQGGAAETEQADTPIDVFIALRDNNPTAEPRLLVDGKDINEAELDAFLRAEVAKNPKVLVRLRADKDVFHKHVVETLDVIKGSGVSRFAIATQLKKK